MSNDEISCHRHYENVTGNSISIRIRIRKEKEVKELEIPHF